MKKFSGIYTTSLATNMPQTHWIFTVSSVVTTNDVGVYLMSGATKSKVEFAGDIVAESYGFLSEASGVMLTVSKTANITSHGGGIVLNANNQTIRNFGSIYGAEEFGIGVGGEHLAIYNAGKIGGPAGIWALVVDSEIFNDRSGRIVGSYVGIVLTADRFDTSTTINHGLIAGRAIAFDSGDGNDTLINSGRIVGDVYLGFGDDRFDGRSGSLKGQVIGGYGSDIYIIDHSEIKLLEDSVVGVDTVWSSVSFQLPQNFERLFLTGNNDINAHGTAGAEYLVGNRGDNDIRGNGGRDALEGRKGDDRLFGGAQSDVFTFRSGDGHDKVMNFENGVDFLIVDDWSRIGGYQGALAHATERDGNLIITAGSDQLTLIGMTKAELDPSDFVI